MKQKLNSQVAEYELYKRIKLLGEGQFGKAYLVECLDDKTKWVIKQMVLSTMSDDEKKETLKEAKILQALQHPNIVKFREVYKTKKGKLCIVMEYADGIQLRLILLGGDLAQLIKQQATKKQYFEENFILDLFTQICLAIKHVHDRDLKGANIFITSNNRIKLGDFGIARILNMTMDKAKSQVGTPYYFSPELVDNKPYSFKSDIWSLGVILFELCALKYPFNGENINMLALRIVRGQYASIPEQFSKEMKKLVEQMLQIDPDKRPSIHEVLKSPIIQKRIKQFLSEAVSKQEFDHTIIHNKQFVNEKTIEILQVQQEVPCPQKLVKKQIIEQQKNDKIQITEQQKNDKIVKMPIIYNINNPQKDLIGPQRIDLFTPQVKKNEILIKPKTPCPQLIKKDQFQQQIKKKYHLKDGLMRQPSAPQFLNRPKELIKIEQFKDVPNKCKNIQRPSLYQPNISQESVQFLDLQDINSSRKNQVKLAHLDIKENSRDNQFDIPAHNLIQISDNFYKDYTNVDSEARTAESIAETPQVVKENIAQKNIQKQNKIIISKKLFINNDTSQVNSNLFRNQNIQKCAQNAVLQRLKSADRNLKINFPTEQCRPKTGQTHHQQKFQKVQKQVDQTPRQNLCEMLEEMQFLVNKNIQFIQIDNANSAVQKISKPSLHENFFNSVIKENEQISEEMSDCCDDDLEPEINKQDLESEINKQDLEPEINKQDLELEKINTQLDIYDKFNVNPEINMPKIFKKEELNPDFNQDYNKFISLRLFLQDTFGQNLDKIYKILKKEWQKNNKDVSKMKHIYGDNYSKLLPFIKENLLKSYVQLVITLIETEYRL